MSKFRFHRKNIRMLWDIFKMIRQGNKILVIDITNRPNKEPIKVDWEFARAWTFNIDREFMRFEEENSND